MSALLTNWPLVGSTVAARFVATFCDYSDICVVIFKCVKSPFISRSVETNKPWSRVPYENVITDQEVKLFCGFYEIWRFITAFIRACGQFFS